MSRTALHPYEGRDVAQATIRVTNAGDGLSKALAVSPHEYHIGDRVFVVLECETSRVHYDVVKDTDLLVRVHTLRADAGTIVAEDLVRDVLDEQRRKIAEAEGVPELPLDDDGDDE